MKKFLSAALVALTTVFMASCGVGSSSEYKQGDPMPSINPSEGTVNGRHYDTETEHCWKITINYKVKSDDSSTKGSETMFVWGTEFAIVSAQETAMWTAAQAGKYASASYGYVRTSEDNYNDCMDRNNTSN